MRVALVGARRRPRRLEHTVTVGGRGRPVVDAAIELPIEIDVGALARIEPAGTGDVRDELGSSYETAYQKLRALEDDGCVSSKKVANARLWFTDDYE